VLAGIENGDFCGEVFGLEDDGGRKVGQRSAVRYIPLGFLAWVDLPNKALSPLLRMSAKSWLPPVCS
jgi:hypothetical protein